jgi:hypothetical protein
MYRRVRAERSCGPAGHCLSRLPYRLFDRGRLLSDLISSTLDGIETASSIGQLIADASDRGRADQNPAYLPLVSAGLYSTASLQRP